MVCSFPAAFIQPLFMSEVTNMDNNNLIVMPFVANRHNNKLLIYLKQAPASKKKISR